VFASLLIALTAALGGEAVAAGSPESGIPSDPGCRAKTEPGSESHRLIFRVRCNFEVQRIVVNPKSPVFGVFNETRLSGDVDPGDRFRCGTGPHRANVKCRGVAGAGATVKGKFETKALTDRCQVKSRFMIAGGVDCPPDAICPAIAFTERIPYRRPIGCA
jgi:hypothetical protein